MWKCRDLNERRFVEFGLHDMNCQEPTGATGRTSITSTTETTTAVSLKATNGSIFLADTEPVGAKVLTTSSATTQRTERVVMDTDKTKQNVNIN